MDGKIEAAVQVLDQWLQRGWDKDLDPSIEAAESAIDMVEASVWKLDDDLRKERAGRYKTEEEAHQSGDRALQAEYRAFMAECDLTIARARLAGQGVFAFMEESSCGADEGDQEAQRRHHCYLPAANLSLAHVGASRASFSVPPPTSPPLEATERALSGSQQPTPRLPFADHPVAIAVAGGGD